MATYLVAVQTAEILGDTWRVKACQGYLQLLKNNQEQFYLDLSDSEKVATLILEALREYKAKHNEVDEG